MQTYTYNFYYTNIGFNCTSLGCLKTQIQKYIHRGRLVVYKNWILASLLESYLISNEVELLENVHTIREWDNVVFLNFPFDKLKNYLDRVRHVMVNYLDRDNAQLCVHTPFRDCKKYSSRKYLPKFPQTTIEDSFVAVCVFLDDNDRTLRRRAETTPSPENPHTVTAEGGTKVGVREGFRGNPELDILYMKMALQTVFTKGSRLVYLIETHDLSKCLHRISEEERLVATLIAQSNDEVRFFLPLGKTPTRIVPEEEYLAWIETVAGLRRRYSAFCLPSPVEVSLLRRINGPTTPVCVSKTPRFALHFSQLQSNISHMLI